MTAEATRSADGTLEVRLPGEPLPYRVLAWRPPLLLLARGNETRSFFVARGAEGTWLGSGGHARWIPGAAPKRARGTAAATDRHGELSSPMPGKVLEVLVTEGESVRAGARLLIVEAMKMEHPVRAPQDGVVSKLLVRAGDSVQPGTTLIELEGSP